MGYGKINPTNSMKPSNPMNPRHAQTEHWTLVPEKQQFSLAKKNLVC